MEIRITVTGPRWLRLPRSRSARLGIVLLVALVVAVPVAWATDRFSDVPTASLHHDDVNTIAGAGITGGCNPPANNLYCPDQSVRRDQMASFLSRGLGRIAVSQAPLVSGVTRNPSDTYTPVAAVTINVGGVAGGTLYVTQYVKVDASLNVFSATECPCRVRFRIRDLTTGELSHGGAWQWVEVGSDHTYTATGVFDAAPGSRTFQLEMWYVSHQGSPTVPEQTLSVGQAYIVATTYPFLSGSSTINAAAAPAGK